jgi:hypothetical protein
MISVALHRMLEVFVADSGLKNVGRSSPDHGRQDKSADRGLAQGLGWIGDFRRRAGSCGWRFPHKGEGIQRGRRRRASEQRSPSQ